MKPSIFLSIFFNSIKYKVLCFLKTTKNIFYAYRFLLSLLCTCVLISSCSTNIAIRSKEADSISATNHFTKQLVKGGDFTLTTYQRITNKDLPYVFYIEGDGYAFNGRYSISDNPTPLHPMLLKLASLDDRPNVVYIARPCQYTDMDLNPKCNESYWTDRRMSEEVVASVNMAIESINNRQNFSLIGYSGGGGIAVLIAARNNRVKDIITLAANLNHVSFNRHHNTKPMIGSLNPIDYAVKIRNIPQLHVSGSADNIVPTFIAEEYIKKSDSPCVEGCIFNGLHHQNNWDLYWKNIFNKPITCYKN